MSPYTRRQVVRGVGPWGWGCAGKVRMVVVASGMLAVFAVAIVVSLIRGLGITCGCFSTSAGAEPISWLYVVRDLLLLGMGVHILLFDQGYASLARLIQTRLLRK